MAQNGVDVTALEKKLKAAGFDLSKVGRKLSDREVEGVAGGFDNENYDHDIKCKCGNNNRDDFSYQYIASLLDSMDWYRCEKCNTYVRVTARNSLVFYSKEDYDRIFWTV